MMSIVRLEDHLCTSVVVIVNCVLVSKDSDYLSVLFHLYDTDEDDDEEAERHKLAQLQKEERRRSGINIWILFLVHLPKCFWRLTHDLVSLHN